MEEPHEIELKFALAPDRAVQILAELPPLAGAATEDLTSIYFDTRRQDLKRAGLALRVRHEDGRYVQTLKAASESLLMRGEWETALPTPDPAPDLLKGTPAAGVLRKGGDLAPQFTIEAKRRSAEVAEGASRISLSLDEGAARAGDKSQPFAELELELKEGPIDGLLSLARRVSQTGDLTLSFTSKAERGFLLARPPRQRALKFAPPPLKPDTPTAEAFQIAASACLRQIVGNAEHLRRRVSPEVLHQLRVGIRRLRSLITTFKPVVADGRLPTITDELKWLTGELDAARNLDVMLRGEFRASLGQKYEADGLKALAGRLRDARRIAYARAASAVEGARFRELLINLLIWIETGPWTIAPKTERARKGKIERFARQALEKRRRKIVKQAKRFADLDVQARHKLRIEAKKLRYAADVFSHLFGRPRRVQRFLAQLKRVQDCLGELNDIVVGEAIAREVAAGASLAQARAAFAAGWITGARGQHLDALTAQAEDALKSFADAKPFW